MKTLSPDTTPEAQEKQFELMRQIPAWKKLYLALELTQAARKLMLADLRRRFTNASEEELRRRFIARVLSREEVITVYGFDPKAEGY